jgi:hypothetical protein
MCSRLFDAGRKVGEKVLGLVLALCSRLFDTGRKVGEKVRAFATM